MNRSFLKLVLVLLLVGVLPFAASLIIVNDLFSQAVTVGINPAVEEHLLRSADAHRRFIEAERLSHISACERIADDPRWSRLGTHHPSDTEAYQSLLRELAPIHPRLTSLDLSSPAWPEPISVDIQPAAPDSVTRRETRNLVIAEQPAELALQFSLPKHYIDELEALGQTLNTYRALDSLVDPLTLAMQKTYLYFTGGVALLALLLGTLLTRQTTRRIGQISEASNRVASGDLSVRIHTNARDEIGCLARQFNLMVQQLQTTQERIAYLQRISAWQEIARRLAHEIKNPLTPILLAMQELARKWERHKQQPEIIDPLIEDTLEIVEEEVRTLQKLVNEFSQLARLPKATLQPMLLAEFLRDFLRTNPQLTGQAQISLDLKPEARDLKAKIDTAMMRRALVNLLENAIDAWKAPPTEAEPREDHSQQPRLEITLDRDASCLVMTISDNGCGLTEEELEKVFDPYFTTKSHGTGLGLSIVKRIIVDHQGWITLQNRADQRGCLATLLLPVFVSQPDLE